MENFEVKTDMDIVLKLVGHIENPCTVEVRGEVRNIREFYLGEAERILPTLTNPPAKSYLEGVIGEYN